ncbi:hypothetical protein DPMN_174510 [Dreissena polymorpha]|uniref:Uncharacterized protein n=1 Tax=Dreissena polymorpha TaxID=45954 RepID=A0A9D4E644_DREPO|nr:hypothetical protein DPMN_174510 [Dreissena polymorpha]
MLSMKINEVEVFRVEKSSYLNRTGSVFYIGRHYEEVFEGYHTLDDAVPPSSKIRIFFTIAGRVLLFNRVYTAFKPNPKCVHCMNTSIHPCSSVGKVTASTQRFVRVLYDSTVFMNLLFAWRLYCDCSTTINSTGRKNNPVIKE